MDDKQKHEDKRWEGQDQPLEFWHSEALAHIQTGSVLDVGCGDGLLQLELKKRGITNTVGVDVSASGIEKVQLKGLQAFKGDVSNLESVLELKDKTFDSITILEVLEHVFDPLSVLRGAKSLLAPKGSLYMSTPNFNAIGDRLRTVRGIVPWQKRPGKGHVYWMNKAIVEGLMKESGFEIIQLSSLGYRRGKSFESLFRYLAKVWPAMFALSFFVHAKPKGM